jgi:hypothetical protein
MSIALTRNRRTVTMRALRTICAYLIISLGIAHIALTGHATGQWVSPRALFFVGSGVALLLMGAMNLVLDWADDDARVRTIGIAANGLGVALFAVGVVVLPQPQVFALLFLTITGFTCSVLLPYRLGIRASRMEGTRAGVANDGRDIDAVYAPRVRRAIAEDER